MLKRLFKYLAYAVVVLVVLVAIAIFALNLPVVKNRIFAEVETAIGRDFSIDGGITFVPGKLTRLTARDLRIGNPSWTTSAAFLQAQRIDVQVDTMALIKGELVVTTVELDGAELNIEFAENGEDNLRFGAATSNSGAAATTSSDKVADNSNNNTSNNNTSNNNTSSDSASKGTAANGSKQELPAILLESLAIRESSINIINPNFTYPIKITDGFAKTTGLEDPLSITAVGAVGATPVDLMLQAETLGRLWRFEPVKVKLTGLVGDNKSPLEATGEVGSFIKWQGIDLQVTSQISALNDVLAFSGQRFAWADAIENLDFKGRFLQPGAWATAQATELNAQWLNWSSADNPAKASGQIANLAKLSGFDIAISANGVTPLLQQLPVIKAFADIKVTSDMQLKGDIDNLVLDINELQADSNDITLSTSGTVQLSSPSPQTRLPLKGTMPALSALQPLSETPLPVTGPIEVNGYLNLQDGELALQELTASSRANGFNVSAKGALTELLKTPKGAFNIQADAGDLAFLRPTLSLDDEVVELAQDLQVEGDITLLDGGLAAKINTATATVMGLALTAKGDVPDLLTLRDSRIDVTGNLANLRDLQLASSATLPDVGPLQVSGALVSQGNGFDFKELTANLDHQALTFDAVGEILDLGPKMRAKMDIFTLISDLPIFNEIAGVDLPKLDLIEGRGILLAESAEQWAMENIALKTVDKPDGLKASSERLDLTSLTGKVVVASKNLPIKQLQDGFPQLAFLEGALTSDIVVSLDDGAGTLEDLDINLVSDDYSLTLARSAQTTADEYTLSINHTPLNKLPFLSEAGFSDNPIDAKITVQTGGLSAEQKSLTMQVDLTAEQNDLKADVVVNLPQENGNGLSIDVDAKSLRLDLNHFLQEAKAAEETNEKSTGPLFSSDPLPLAWMDGLSVDVKFRADRFINRVIHSSNLSADLKVADGKLDIKSSGDIEQGELQWQAAIDTNQQPTSVDLSVNGKRLDLGALRAITNENLIDDGSIDVQIDLQGNGASPQALAASLDGAVQLRLSESTMKAKALSIIGGDILDNLLKALNPFKSADERVIVECGLVHFDVVDGKATSEGGLALKTKRFTLFGYGDVNLNDEKLDLVVTPKARRGLGITPGSFVDVLKIGGKINKPEIELNPEGVLTSGLNLTAAVATGGVTLLLKGLLDRYQADGDVCDYKPNKKAPKEEQAKEVNAEEIR